MKFKGWFSLVTEVQTQAQAQEPHALVKTNTA